MLYVICIALIAALANRRVRVTKPTLPEPITADWTPLEPAQEPEEEPEREAEEDPAVLLALADIERYEATKAVYIDLLDALEEEAAAIARELSTDITDARRTTLAHRKSTLLGKIATTTAKLHSFDRQIERAYIVAAKEE